MMVPDFIPRNRPDPDNLDFDGLKRQGFALTQGLSGLHWTDYNQHDPGVTILEQLCYGLTDLAYRSGLPVEDYLGGERGIIDYERLALFPPQEILPSRPVTANDYRKLLYDAIPEIEDVWLKATRVKGLHANGLYTVHVKLDDNQFDGANNDARKAALSRRVMEVYSAHRNLCEDIDEVRIIDTAAYYLSGEIEIKGQTPAKVFADIFFQCSKRISSAIKIDRYEDVFAEGRSREDVFCGPLTSHGHIDDSGMRSGRETISTVKLIALIRQIDGVVQVRNLALRDASGNVVDDIACDPSRAGFPELTFPETAEQKRYLQFAVSKNARTGRGESENNDEAEDEKSATLIEAARLELKKLVFEFHAFRASRDTVERFIKLPQASPRDLADYYSIQNQFPAIYGINHYGIPRSAPVERQAKGKQLKAYLYPFEQLMANYLQTLEGIGRLFSTDTELTQSYFTQFLGNSCIPNIEGLYENGAAQTAADVAAITAQRDNVGDRRNRVLDVLLALYGEEFPSDSFHLHNDYRPGDEAQWLIESKIAYLKNLPDISCNRNAAIDYLQDFDAEGNTSGLQRKVSLLLGISAFQTSRSLTKPLLEKNIRLTPDPDTGNVAEQAGDPVGTLPPEDKEAAMALSFRNGAIHTSMFRRGVDLSNFVLTKHDNQVVVGFRIRENSPLWQLGKHKDVHKATVFAHQFRNAIVQLNMQSEGMHVVEHLLLRPQGKGMAKHGNVEPPVDFYSSRISIMLPAWTARFSNHDFRRTLEETVCRNLAAHVFPEFHWLDFADMQIFEKYQQQWRTALVKRVDTNDFSSLNAASEKLIAFLLKKRAHGTRNYWV